MQSSTPPQNGPDQSSRDPAGKGSSSATSSATGKDLAGARINHKSPVIKTAYKKLCGLCIGNGLRKKDIVLKSVDGQIFPIKAEVKVEPDVKTKSHERKGKVSGDKVFRSKADMDAALEDLKESLTKNRNIFQTIIKQVQSRPDKGIGLDNKTLPLKTLDQSYVYYDPCSVCHEQGRTTCPSCHGNKQIPCIRCQGRRNVQCAVCGGSGNISGPDGGQKTCPRCQGRSQIPCDYCHGRGQTKCDRCGGAGSSTCANCGGAGVNSQVTQIQIQAKLDCEYKIDNPAGQKTYGLENILDDLGPDIVLKKMAKITESEAEQDERGLPILNYILKMPHARMMFHVKQKETEAIVTGYSSQFTKIPALLDAFIEPAVSFSSSKKAKSAPITALNKIGRIKIFRQAMALTSQSSVNATADKLEHKYKGLMSQDLIGRIALQTNILLNKSLRKPRVFSASVLGLFAAGICGGFYIGPGLSYFSEALGSVLEPLTQTLPDIRISDLCSFGLLAVLWAIAAPLNKAISRAYFKKRIGRVLPDDYCALLLSRLGQHQWLPYMVVTIIFLGFYIGYRAGLI